MMCVEFEVTYTRMEGVAYHIAVLRRKGVGGESQAIFPDLDIVGCSV